MAFTRHSSLVTFTGMESSVGILIRLRLVPQPLVALLLSVLASIALGAAWLGSGQDSLASLASIEPGNLVLAGVLGAWVAASYLFPIHVKRCQKVEMTSVALYLMAVLLPTPSLAALSAGLGILVGEMLVRTSRGNFYSD